MKFFSLLLLFLTTSISLAQYPVRDIPKNLIKGANAIVRNENVEVVLKRYDKVEVSKERVVTVFNRHGLDALDTSFQYDSDESIKNIEAVVYDSNGEKIKKFKSRDFKDVSASGGYLYVDNRLIYLDYTPSSYPFTVVYSLEYTSKNTAFLPGFSPIEYTSLSIENSTYKLVNETDIGIKKLEKNLDSYSVKSSKSKNVWTYSLKNAPPFKNEVMAPNPWDFLPSASLSPKQFSLSGVAGNVDSWQAFGVWQYENLLKNRDQLDDNVVTEISQLLTGVEDTKEKVRLIYEFMQNKTRYVNIAIGIGGWKPMTAADVHKLSYGDCKGLTNYTKALLASQGIPSYYTIVYSGAEGQDIKENFVAMQGNHVILTVPFEEEEVFLECTSQSLPYNYLSDFTDDRKVLMIKPEGAVFTNTHTYTTADNLQKLEAKATLSPTLKLSGRLTETSEGIPYGEKYGLESAVEDDISMHYKELWGHLNNLTVANVSFENDKDEVRFSEKLNFETNNYVSTAGDIILFNPNIFNRYKTIPDREDERKLPLEIRRGRTYEDEIEVLLPETHQLDAAFEPIKITSKFGTYIASVTSVDASKIRYSRKLVLNSGVFPPEAYDGYVDFIQQVVKKDKSKIVLKPI